jgi:arginine-tRNA-protein transferase
MSRLPETDVPFSLQLCATAPYPCSYLPEAEARSQMVVASCLVDTEIYSELVRHGFRRSGGLIYRPWCDQCRACVSVRLPVERLELSRSQRRALKQHVTLSVNERALRFDERHYALYLRYQARRHPGGGMDEEDRDQYAQFLLESWVDSRLVEFSEGGEIRMVSLIDVLDDGISSVYTFFDPDIPGTAYGTYNILWQAHLCAQQNLPYLYLGYWVQQMPEDVLQDALPPDSGLPGRRLARSFTRRSAMLAEDLNLEVQQAALQRLLANGKAFPDP